MHLLQANQTPTLGQCPERMTDLIRNFMAHDFTDQLAGLVAALAKFGKKMCHNMVHKMCFQVGQEALDQQHGRSLWVRHQRVIHPVGGCLNAKESPQTLKTSRITNWLSQPCADSGGGTGPATCTPWGGSLLGPCTVGRNAVSVPYSVKWVFCPS